MKLSSKEEEQQHQELADVRLVKMSVVVSKTILGFYFCNAEKK